MNIFDALSKYTELSVVLQLFSVCSHHHMSNLTHETVNAKNIGTTLMLHVAGTVASAVSATSKREQRSSCFSLNSLLHAHLVEVIQKISHCLTFLSSPSCNYCLETYANFDTKVMPRPL